MRPVFLVVRGQSAPIKAVIKDVAVWKWRGWGRHFFGNASGSCS